MFMGMSSPGTITMYVCVYAQMSNSYSKRHTTTEDKVMEAECRLSDQPEHKMQFKSQKLKFIVSPGGVRT